MSYPTVLYGPESERFATYTNQRFPLGTELHLQDGRVFRFGENGGVAATPGTMFQSEVPDGNFDSLVTPAQAGTAIGSRAIIATLPAATVAVNLFAEGFVVTEAAAGSGEGYAYKIDSHLANAGSLPLTLNLAAGNGLAAAITVGADTLTLVRHPLRDVIIAPSPPTAAVIGVAAAAIALDCFGWFQVRGPCACLVLGTWVIGGSLSPGGTVTNGADGALEATGVLITATAPTIAQETEIVRVGICMEVAPTTGYGLALLNMA